jgi:hypothetical protein
MPTGLQKKRDNQRFVPLEASPTFGAKSRSHRDLNEFVKNRLHRPPGARRLDLLPLALKSAVVSMR